MKSKECNQIVRGRRKGKEEKRNRRCAVYARKEEKSDFIGVCHSDPRSCRPDIGENEWTKVKGADDWGNWIKMDQLPIPLHHRLRRTSHGEFHLIQVECGIVKRQSLEHSPRPFHRGLRSTTQIVLPIFLCQCLVAESGHRVGSGAALNSGWTVPHPWRSWRIPGSMDLMRHESIVPITKSMQYGLFLSLSHSTA